MELGEWQKCPICDGVGQVSAGYFTRGGDRICWITASATPEKCRVCDGKGIIARPRLEEAE